MQARGARYLAALGGRGNLESIEACTTRLRLVVHDQQIVDEAQLKALGARGVIRVSDHGLQVVIGPIADQLAREMRDEAVSALTMPLAVPRLDNAAVPVVAAQCVQATPSLAMAQQHDSDVDALLAAFGG